MKCDKKMTFAECELAVLRHAVDKIETKTGKKIIKNPQIQKIIHIVEVTNPKTKKKGEVVIEGIESFFV